MPSVRRRHLTAAALAVLATLMLGGCGTGFSAQTNQQYQPGVGTDLRTGPVQVLGGLFVDNGNGTATFSGGLLNMTSEDQQLTSAKVIIGTDTNVSAGPSQPIDLAPRTLFTAGTTGEIIVAGSNARAGDYVTLDLTFGGAGDVQVSLPVVTRVAEYDSVAKRAARLPSA